MTITSTDILRVSCRFKSTEAGDIVNVYHLWIISGGPFADDDVVTDIETWLSALYATVATQIPANVDPYDLRVDLVELNGGLEKVIRNVTTKTWTLTSPPSSGSEGLPLTTAPIVNLRTVFPRVFGRKYLPPANETRQANGVLDSTMLTALANFAAYLIADYTGATVTFRSGVLSVKAGPAAKYFAAFVGSVVNAVLGTQRRRRQNVGS